MFLLRQCLKHHTDQFSHLHQYTQPIVLQLHHHHIKHHPPFPHHSNLQNRHHRPMEHFRFTRMGNHIIILWCHKHHPMAILDTLKEQNLPTLLLLIFTIIKHLVLQFSINLYQDQTVGHLINHLAMIVRQPVLP
uniref:Uncharacterized protein n=1 Tax=Cacopsylla melanoneura TaxID=428564 RepID=A0A8D8Z1Y6_9HEMI